MAKFLQCASGAVAVISAMVLPLLLGFGSMGVEVGHWYLTQRQMQGAADAAAISAAAQYIADFPTNPNSTTYQTVGQSYAATNGFAIPVANVCLIKVDGTDNCSPVLALDSRPIVCLPTQRPCVVVEITQDTFTWLTTQTSVRPTSTVGHVQGIPTPILKARAVVSSQITVTTSAGTNCILALANDPMAISVHGNGDLRAACGIAVDGGLTQNLGGTAVGNITFSGSNATAHINALEVASSTASTNVGCPPPPLPPALPAHCYMYNPSTVALPTSAIFPNTATPDPYAGIAFPPFPLGVQTGGVAPVAQGSGYTPGLRTFTVVGGTGTPAKFTATVPGSGANTGKITGTLTVVDPGAYTVFPTGTVTVTPDTGGGSGGTFTLTDGCFGWTNTAIPGRTYCSITPTGTIMFPAGDYYIAGGSNGGCVGFCVSGNGHHITSDAAGITFYLGKGYGANSRGPTVTANASITGFGNSTTLSLCAPGTGCGTGCTGSCLLFVQDPTATVSTGQSVSTSCPVANPNCTVNSFSGNGNSTISGLVYLPNQSFISQGNSEIRGCFGVVAKYVDVGGTPTFTNGCLPGNGIGGGTTTVLLNPFLSQ